MTFAQQVSAFLRRGGWEKRLAFLLAIAAPVCGLLTYAALSATPPFGNDTTTVIWVLNADLTILLLLVALIARRIVLLWSGRRRGLPGARLHARLVFVFSLLAAIPAIVMTVFSAAFFHFGVQTWFSDRVRTAIDESQAVAEAYLQEHQQVIRADTLAMAGDIDRQASVLMGNEDAFESVIQTQSFLRNLSEAIVFDGAGRILAQSGLSFTLSFESIPQYELDRARDGDVVVMTGGDDDRVRALVHLDNFTTDTFLFVGRMVDSKVLSHLTATREASQEYRQLETRYSDFQVTATMIFVVVGLVMILAAIWFGLFLAGQLVRPISALVEVAERVRSGDLTARVPAPGTLDEFDVLAGAFNRMTSQIEAQRDDLVSANRQLDTRRRFTEAVLSGVSSGVVGIDREERVTIANAAAARMLNLPTEDQTGCAVVDLIPDLAPLLAQARAKSGKVAQGEIPFRASDGHTRALLVRIAIDSVSGEDRGAVLTFDDITELQSAQRKAAWADVARRIAHEIKNPLTPIQLSAERLRRRYLKQIQNDPETFEKCTDTIIRQVEDIGRMVGEFSAFARMPEPVMTSGNPYEIVRDAVFLHRQAHPEIEFVVNTDAWQRTRKCWLDAGQIGQALTNLLANAVDSVRARLEKEKALSHDFKGRIEVVLASPDRGVAGIAVCDNGLGLPESIEPSRLSEPYVTFKEKGTGLGLAIVGKIMEDHGGSLVIGAPEWVRGVDDKKPEGGAVFVLILPIGTEEADSAAVSGACGDAA